MYYRPRPKKRHPLLTFFLYTVFVVMLGVLGLLLGIYLGYFDYELETSTLTEPFRPTPTPTRPAVLEIADGDIYFAEGKLREAVAAYERAIQADPANDIPYIRQSKLLVYTRNTAKAVERAAQAVLRNPTSPENLAYYCRALDWEARYAEAYDACACAIELDPNYAEGYAFLSEVYADQGEWRLARSTAQQALEANYQSLDAHHNMGYALEVQGRYVEAVEYYENAIKLAPNLGPLYVDAGQLYFSLADYETAADYFRQAIRLTPTDPQPYNWLGWTYYVSGEYVRALDALEQSIGLDPTYTDLGRGRSAWGHMAQVYYTRQNFEKVVQLLPKAIELAESQFLRRARQIEIYTEVETLVGPESVPILRGSFDIPDDRNTLSYGAVLEPVSYESKLEVDPDQSCAASIVRSIQNKAVLVGPTESLTFTQRYSETRGTATLNLTDNSLSLSLDALPPAETPYEIYVTFWPNRTDRVGTFQPDEKNEAQLNIIFEERLSAPIEYYYELGLAYVYLEPSQCDEAVPWLLKSLEIDQGYYNPAWAGLRICPSSESPPTPLPTWTPRPEEG